jgi:hypothetical protein
MAMAVIGMGAWLLLSGDSPAPAATTAPNPRQAETDARLMKAAIVMKLLKDSLREPDSMVIDKALASQDGNVICIRYRGRNGFGGMSVEQLIISGTQQGSTEDDWRRHCGPATYDVRAALTLIR